MPETTMEYPTLFDLAADLLHFNHAAVAPWPKRTTEAVCRFAHENAHHGSLNYPSWQAVEQRLKERLARLIGAADASEIALTKSTSEGLSLIAYGLDWHPGDNIVGIAQEFPSNRLVWQSLATRGVEWRALDLEHTDDPEAALLALCDASTRLMAVSWVQYARGLRLDLARLAAGCQQRGVLLIVDAIQGLGAVPFDLATCPADAVVADGHKWLCGPEGLALFYCRPALRDQLTLLQYGWHMVEELGDFDRTTWQPAASARRFECGSPNMLGIHALDASLALIEEIGMSAIAQALQARVDYLLSGLDGAGFEVLSPRDPARRAGIVTFRVPEVAAETLYPALIKSNLLCALRGGGIRFSPHFYTSCEKIDQAIAMVKQVTKG